MTDTNALRPFARAIHALVAAALAAFILANSWSVVRVFDLARADLQYQGAWIGDHARRVTAVSPGGPADRAGLGPGDVLEFDPRRDADWVLASYRHMPAGFTATLPVRHPDGSRAVATLVPERVPYLDAFDDKLALVVRLAAWTLLMLLGVFMVWARPSVMTWSLLLAACSGGPLRLWMVSHLAFEAEAGFSLVALLLASTWAWAIAIAPFGLCFPRESLAHWPRWQRWLGLALALTVVAYMAAGLSPQPFERDPGERIAAPLLAGLAVVSDGWAIAALARTYRRSSRENQARLKWALLGVSAAILGVFGSFLVPYLMFGVEGSSLLYEFSGSQLTAAQWVMAASALLMTVSLGYAVLRQRVVDVQFAISRTLAYGTVSTLALVFLTAVHWLLGRLIEHSGLAFGLEGIAAVSLGLVLHRASHGISLLVDRVLFRRHHQAEERLRRVTAALPFASDERSIAEALVTEPARNFDLASAALFHRAVPDGPLRRVLAQGWGEEHAASLEADSLLVRYLQAEHEPLRLDDPHLLPTGVPQGTAMPVLAVPVVNQHALTAVVLYGAHANHTLPDPDEVDLLRALARAAATSQQQVRIATLARENAALAAENAALAREHAVERSRNDRLEDALRARL